MAKDAGGGQQEWSQLRVADLVPYYDDGQITIYHGDCRAILPQLPGGSVDLLLTDPPYGQNWQSDYRNDAFPYMAGDHDPTTALQGIRLALRCLKHHRHMYIFGRFDFCGLPTAASAELIWDKGMMSGGDWTSPWGKQHEYIQFAVYRPSEEHRARGQGLGPARLRKGTVLAYPRVNGSGVECHPTEKPVRLLRELIESSSRIGETVLDPFMGVGSSLVAAHLEGRRAIGIEIEEKYCEIAVKRLAQQVLAI